ncbi:MAG: hypothetical protein ACPIA5_00420, partial [Flavobacteriales bacterium]
SYGSVAAAAAAAIRSSAASRPTYVPPASIASPAAGILLGVTFKLNHLMGAHTLFNVGVVLTTLGVGLWVIQLIRGRGE